MTVVLEGKEDVKGYEQHYNMRHCNMKRRKLPWRPARTIQMTPAGRSQ